MAETPYLNKAVSDLLGITGGALKVEPMKKGGMRIRLDADIQREMKAQSKEPMSLEKAIARTLNQVGDVERLAFETDPTASNKYHSLYKTKYRLIPDKLLKRIAIQDDLVAAIVQVRQNQMAAFGRQRPDRFSTGFVIEARQATNEAIEKLPNPEEKKAKKEELQKRISRVTKRLMSCGDDNLDLAGNQDKLTFPQYISMSVRNAVVVGRLATEVLYRTGADGKDTFAGFRVIDAGTIYRCEPQQDAAESVRKTAAGLLASLRNDDKVDIDQKKFENDEYAWVQVIDDRPVQAFTAKECLVHSFYQVPDVELDGYPVTPLDTAITAVTTHINITSHNKLYFQSGRAARGMLVFKSEDVDEDIVSRIRQQFNAQINSVNNAWRMPVFAVGPEDDVQWQPIDSGSRDMEFQYLADMNARVIMSAFQISPEEVPGWAYLSRGTNNQALCLHYHSGIWTDAGFKTIGQVLENSDEERIRIWTGTTWADARVFKTGPKQNALTVLGNGSRLQTSPDHRFRAIGPEGTPVWKRQSELTIGDSVLVNKLPISGVGEVPVYGDRPLTEEMMEVLGWLTGDGNISVRFNKNTGNIKQGVLSWFYHHEKERDIWERHATILTDFGLSLKHQDRQISEAEAADLKTRYGFKSVALNRLRNTLYNTDFWRWLASLGFQSSTDGKTIPSFIHALPVGHRQAFLRGLFSADGTCVRSGADAVRIVVHDDRLRQQTRELLLSLGIRTQFHEGKLKQDLDGTRRCMIAGASTLTIKDKLAFYEQIGFLQPHKQPRPDVLADSEVRRGRVPAAVATRLLHGLGSVPNVPRACTNGCTIGFLRRILTDASRPFPNWLEEYHLEEIVCVQTLDEVVDMADVEVFDKDHAFIADGVSVHNSESNNEYRLEASRDVGIRPLLAHFEDFLNQQILPLFDEALAEMVVIKLVGLDAETAEKESVRIQQDMPVHMTYDEVLEKVEKKAIGKRLGGEYPLNPQFQAILDKFIPVGVQLEEFFGQVGASKDPQFAYLRDPFWFQQQQMMQAQQQMQMQQQQAQQAAAMGQPPPGSDGGGGGSGDDKGGGGGDDSGGSPPSGEGAKPTQETSQTENQKSAQMDEASASPGGQDLTRSIDQALGAVDMLSKAESQLPPSKRKLLQKQKMLVADFLAGWEEDAAEAHKDILGIAEQLAPKHKPKA